MVMTRRKWLGGAAALAVCTASVRASANSAADAYFAGTDDDTGFIYHRTNVEALDPIWLRQMVEHDHPLKPGTITIDTKAHFLYLAFEDNQALRYGVGVGREGFQWSGHAEVGRKEIWPGWTPPRAMLAREPGLPRHMAGGPDNPLGPRALYLHRNGRDLGYRLHGTLEPWTIGTDASSGCIRLLPEDIMDLYERVPLGTHVTVLDASV